LSSTQCRPTVARYAPEGYQTGDTHGRSSAPAVPSTM
jgi:hypothetical protein